MTELVRHYRDQNWTTSTLVAKELGKAHMHVLEKIRKLLLQLDNLNIETSMPKSFPEKFILENYVNDRGQTYERYRMNKPAFTLFLMQVTGKKALKAQRTFNQAFYEMEQYILKLDNTAFKAARAQGKLARAVVTTSIQRLVDHATKQGSKHARHYYSTITTETYKALGYLARGEKVGSEFRNHLDNLQLAELFIAETLASQVIDKGVDNELHYKEIYLLAKQKVVAFGIAQQRLQIK